MNLGARLIENRHEPLCFEADFLVHLGVQFIIPFALLIEWEFDPSPMVGFSCRVFYDNSVDESRICRARIPIHFYNLWGEVMGILHQLFVSTAAREPAC